VGWRLSDQAGPHSPALTSRRSRPGLPSCQLSDLDAHPFALSCCLDHRAQAAREYHPQLPACATAAAVLCGNPQIRGVSLRELGPPKRQSFAFIDGFPQPEDRDAWARLR
jgi:hypothetical protein